MSTYNDEYSFIVDRQRFASNIGVVAPIAGAGMGIVTGALVVFLGLTNPNVETLTFPVGLVVALAVAAAFGVLVAYGVWFVVWCVLSAVGSSTARRRVGGRVLSVAVSGALVFVVIVATTNSPAEGAALDRLIAAAVALSSALIAVRFVARDLR